MIPRPTFASARTRRLATRALSGRLGPRGRRILQGRLATSTADRLAYDRLARLFRALEGDPPLASGQRQGILVALHARLAEDRPSRAAPWLRRLAPVLALPLLLLAPLLLVLDDRAPPPPGRDSSFQGRGSTTPLTAGKVGLEIFCARRGALVPPPSRLTEAQLDARCQPDDELQLLITHTAGYSRLLVVGELRTPAGDSRTLWYHPVPPTGQSGEAPRGVEREPLGSAIHLAVNHGVGQLRVVALFSHATLEAASIFPWLQTLEPTESAAELLAHLGAGGLVAIERRAIIEEAQ